MNIFSLFNRYCDTPKVIKDIFVISQCQYYFGNIAVRYPNLHYLNIAYAYLVFIHGSTLHARLKQLNRPIVFLLNVVEGSVPSASGK